MSILQLAIEEGWKGCGYSVEDKYFGIECVMEVSYLRHLGENLRTTIRQYRINAFEMGQEAVSVRLLGLFNLVWCSCPLATVKEVICVRAPPRAEIWSLRSQSLMESVDVLVILTGST